MSGPFANPPDGEARLRAATEFETNLVVTAGAGTGKTSLLIERILTAVGLERASIEQLAAITFTDKAAGEIRSRLALGLERLRALAVGELERDPTRAADRAFDHLARAGVPGAKIAARALEALANLDRARVETIHTFCSGLLREHPVEAGVDPAFVVDQGKLYRSLREDLWEDFLAREMGAAAGRPELWERILDRLSLESVRETALALAEFGVPEELLAPPPVDGGAVVREEIDDARRAVDSILEHQRGMTKPTRDYFHTVRDALSAFDEGGVPALLRFVAAHDDLLRRIRKGNYPKPTTRLEGVTAEEMKRASAASLRLVKDLLRVDEDLLVDLVEATAPFAREARELLLKSGHVTFDALLVLARNLLRDHPTVRERVKRDCRMLLVDEFQDTDPLQYEIVLFLAETEGGSATDPFEAALSPGRLFIVGDPKQSIYRFRGADYTAFRLVAERIERAGGARLALTANFRSVPAIVDSVNALMEPGKGCWTGSDYQPEYEAIDPLKPSSGDDPQVEIWTVGGSAGASATKRRESEGRIIAEEVERSVKENEVAVLLRAFTSLAHYLRGLRERNVPFVVDGGREFLERPEVGHLLAILKALARPSDPAALLAFLRSPAGGVADVELAEFAAAGHRWNWRDEVDPAFPAVAAAFELLRGLDETARDSRPDEVIRLAVARSNLLVLSAAAFEGPQRVANLKKLATLAGELAREGRLSLIEVVEALEEGRTADVESDSPLADEQSDAVRVTTIHKAKGLEYDVVVVPDMARQEGHTGSRERVEVDVFRLRDGRQHLSLKVDNIRNLARVRFEREKKRHEDAEEVRVLYVALTRARKRLILMAAKPRTRAHWIEALRTWGYDADDPPEDGQRLLGGRMIHRLRAASRPSSRHADELPDRATEAVRAFHEARERVNEAAVKPLAAPSEEERWRAVGDEAGPSGARRFASGELSRAVGVVAHRLLETWDGREDTKLIEKIGGACGMAASEAGLDRGSLERGVREIFAVFLASDLRRRLRGIDILGRELPMLLATGSGVTYRGTIDLLYRDESGEYVVADYKTDTVTDAGTLERRYAKQLAIYARAAEKALKLPSTPRAELWLLRSGTSLPLTPHPH